MAPRTSITCGDGIAGLEALEPGSAALVIADPPWGATRAQWDRPPAWERWWAAIDHALAARGVVALFASMRLALTVAPLAPRRFSYDLVWRKNRASGHLNAKRAPLRAHESILIFGDTARGEGSYRPQFTHGHAPMHAATRRSKSILYGTETVTSSQAGSTIRRAVSVLDVDVVPNDSPIRIHATQKPVELLRWLVRAYAPPGSFVVDPMCGSGASMHAARAEGCTGIGWELDPVAADKAQRWLDGRDVPLFAGVAS
jgi:DNA modification methylase